MAVGAALTYFIGFYWWGTRTGIAFGHVSINWGLLTYSYLNLGLEGTQYWIEQSGTAFDRNDCCWLVNGLDCGFDLVGPYSGRYPPVTAENSKFN